MYLYNEARGEPLSGTLQAMSDQLHEAPVLRYVVLY